MDEAGDFCSSLGPRAAAAARELLLAALEDLSQEQLKRFRHKLRDAPGGGRSIPWGRLERADPVDLAEQMTHFYGPEPALDVARKALKRADVRDVAARLKAQQLQRLSPSASGPPSLSEFQKRYREHVLRQHARVKERNARSVSISRRFTKLLLAPESAAAAERPEAERARRSDTRTFHQLFGRDEAGARPLTVVLQGPAGIGKTMAAQKILYDWAAGKLYQGQVDFAFFLGCRELLERPGARSLAELVLEQCPDRGAPVARVLARPQRLLFILDGADELPAPGAAEAAPCTDPFGAASGARVLRALLAKELLPAARLLVTTRAAPAGGPRGSLRAPRCSEVRGFGPKDRKKFFYKFFRDERQAERAYRCVKENEPLLALCCVPFVCWIVCTVLLQQLDLGQSLARASKTTTSVYLLFLASVLGSAGADGPQVRRDLRQLGLLARDGVLGRQARFTERDLERRDLLGSQVQTLFLRKKELPGVLDTEVLYQFTDQSVQEFFAALSCLLEDEGQPGAPADGVGRLLSSDSEPRGHLRLTRRFLFGLLSTERMSDIERRFGCTVPVRAKQDALQWVQDRGQPAAAPDGMEKTRGPEDTEDPEEEDEDEDEDEGDEGEESSFHLELLYCLYETQEDTFVRQALGGLPELTVEGVRFRHMDLEVLSYCVRRCPPGQALHLISCCLVAAQKTKEKRSLAKHLRRTQATRRKLPASPLHPLCEAMTDQQCGLSSLVLSHCKLPDGVCRDLSLALRTAPALTEVGLLHCRISEAGLRVLSEGLAWPQCHVQTLRMLLPIPLGALQHLVSMLQKSTTLATLDLSGCQLPGPIVTSLCAVLQSPGCSLKNLSLVSVELSEQSLQKLWAVKTANPDLVILHPALGNHPDLPQGFSSAL